IKCTHPANALGSAEVNRDRQSYSPRTKGFGDMCQLRNKICAQDSRIRVHVVNGAGVNANRRQQSGILAHARQVSLNPSAFEKDGAAGIAALDASVEVVPLAGTTYGR